MESSAGDTRQCNETASEAEAEGTKTAAEATATQA